MGQFSSRSDGELWRLARTEPDAFGELFERHARAVYAFCARRTASLSVAEDLTSVVFLEAWKQRARVEISGGAVLPWLLGVANNVARNWQRALRRHQAALARLPVAAAFDSEEDEVTARVDVERSLAAAQAAIDALPPGERDVAALVLWGGLSYEQAAQALTLPVGTVQSRLARARRKLQRSLPTLIPTVKESR
jgi:RNA polymerase sigma-70 factor (ECF subfamily)